MVRPTKIDGRTPQSVPPILWHFVHIRIVSSILVENKTGIVSESETVLFRCSFEIVDDKSFSEKSCYSNETGKHVYDRHIVNTTLILLDWSADCTGKKERSENREEPSQSPLQHLQETCRVGKEDPKMRQSTRAKRIGEAFFEKDYHLFLLSRIARYWCFKRWRTMWRYYTTLGDRSFGIGNYQWQECHCRKTILNIPAFAGNSHIHGIYCTQGI